MSAAVEKEVSAITKLKVTQYDDRQDFLAAVARALDKVKEDIYDNLSEEAYQWHKAAADALVAKEELPDFDGSLPSEAEEAEDAPEPADDDDSTDSADDDGDNADDDPENDEGESEETEPAPKSKGKGKPAKPKTETTPAKPAKKTKPEKVKGPRKSDVDYTKLTGELDRYGITKGTKTAQAIEMYEKGATSKEINEKLEGRYYNILTKLQAEGHLVEKKDGAFKLTHKDDIKSAKPKKGK